MEKESKDNIPEMGEIAAEFKELGCRLKEVFVTAAQSTSAKKLQKDVLDSFDFLADKAGQVIDDAKSGDLEKDVKQNLHQTLKKVNQKLKNYQENIGSTDEKPEDKES